MLLDSAGLQIKGVGPGLGVIRAQHVLQVGYWPFWASLSSWETLHTAAATHVSSGSRVGVTGPEALNTMFLFAKYG